MNIYEIIYSYCKENEKELKQCKNCTCLYCGKNFDYEEIKFWISDKNEKTAVCPFCSIDSVVPTEMNEDSAQYTMSKEIREKIKKIYFG